MKKCDISCRGAILASPVSIADSFFPRFRGLMMKKRLAPGEGLLLENCSAIHCCFMHFPIDVLYLDAQLTVVGMECVKPWRLGHLYPGTKHVLEMAAGSTAGIRPGDRLERKDECEQ